MNCLMPELDGFETTKKIRHRERDRRHTIIVGTSAKASTFRDFMELGLKIGMDDFLGKPFEPQKLYDKILYWKQQISMIQDR
jgi:CheY-like chemotaxis protein